VPTACRPWKVSGVRPACRAGGLPCTIGLAQIGHRPELSDRQGFGPLPCKGQPVGAGLPAMAMVAALPSSPASRLLQGRVHGLEDVCANRSRLALPCLSPPPELSSRQGFGSLPCKGQTMGAGLPAMAMVAALPSSPASRLLQGWVHGLEDVCANRSRLALPCLSPPPELSSRQGFGSLPCKGQTVGAGLPAMAMVAALPSSPASRLPQDRRMDLKAFAQTDRGCSLKRKRPVGTGHFQAECVWLLTEQASRPGRRQVLQPVPGPDRPGLGPGP
jgi:hypothetical protein